MARGLRARQHAIHPYRRVPPPIPAYKFPVSMTKRATGNGDMDLDDVEGESDEDAEDEDEDEDDRDGAEHDDGEDAEEETDEDEDAESSSEGSPNSDNHSDHLRDRLAKALDHDIAFSGTFSFKRAYPDAPNPSLRLGDLNLVGLPLSEREATVVKSRCKQAPFGKGERTLVDKTVRDTWEMDAANVGFDSPHWQIFIDRIVKDVCQVLGVNFEASKPKCELYKLLLYETGSHFLPHVDTEKVDGMFATIVIVLPSQFSGGASHLSHGGLSTVYDCSVNSSFDTTVMSWYTDVMHEIKPITTGYWLALSYNLIHTTQNLRPALSVNVKLIRKLRRFFNSWNKNDGQGLPEKIVYLLDHQYSQANLSASALKGADAHRVAILESLAADMGFKLGLASVSCHLIGTADDWGRSSRANLQFDEAEEMEMKIEHFVDLTGTLIAPSLDFDEETETVPVELADKVEHGPHDKEEYEGYSGNEAGTLERWYRRSLLVIWPKRNDYGMLYSGPKGFQQACQELSSSNSETPSDREIGLGEYLLSKYESDAPAVVQTVMTCCGHRGLSILTRKEIRQAITVFTLEKIQPALDLLVKSSQRNSTRFKFLSSLKKWATECTDLELAHSIKAWVNAQQLSALKDLRKPLQDDIGHLLSSANDHGGLEFLKAQMLNQITHLAEDDFLLLFARAVHDEQSFPDSQEKGLVIEDLLTTAIGKASFHRPPEPTKPYYGGHTGNTAKLPAPVDTLTKIKTYIEICTDLHSEKIVGIVMGRITDTSQLTSTEVQRFAEDVMIPLITFLAERRQTSPERVDPAQFRKLQESAIGVYLGWLSTHAYYVFTMHFRTLFQAVITGVDDLKMLVEYVWPRLKVIQFSPSSLEALCEELHPYRRLGAQVSAMISRLAGRYVTQVNLDQASSVIPALDWCCRMRQPELCANVFQRICDVNKMTAQYLNAVLIPLLPDMKAWAAKQDYNIGSVYQVIVVAWTEKVLGGQPPTSSSLATQINGLTSWTCACAPCISARNFLTRGENQVITFARIGATDRKHVEKYLSVHAQSLTTWQTINSKPQGLKINKSDAVHKVGRWKSFQAKGNNILKTLGADDAELRRVLGPQYNRVALALKGTLQGQAYPRPTLSLSFPPVVSKSVPGPSKENTNPRPPSQTTEGPVRKKRKVAYNPNAVIDLT